MGMRLFQMHRGAISPHCLLPKQLETVKTKGCGIAVISIVDDDPSVREAMLGLVRSLGFDAVMFSSAEDFLQSDQIDETSCLITDVQMPGLSGVELQSCLISRGSLVPIIFVTASPERRIEAQVRSAGAVGFLNKPFDDNALIECLDRALGCRKNARH
jgi:FixJ family two-component response regulator